MFDSKTKIEIAKIAKRLEVPVAALLAVAEVESGGRVLAKVRGKQEPLIRFEGHYFNRFLRGDAKLEAQAEGLASSRAGAVKNPRSQSNRWKLLNRAIKINRIAALSSVSWGLGQVMGAHWKWLGYGSVDVLVEQARSGVVGQVALMVRYIEKAGLVKALQERDWLAFARTYNGPAFYKNKYDTKLAAAFKRISKELGEQELPAVETLVGEKIKDGRLMFGARGSLVKELQQALTRCGYILVADGLFGLVTDRVVRQFQRDHLITQTGIVGAAERALIFGVKNPVIKCIQTSKLKSKKKSLKVLQSTKNQAKSVAKKIRRGLRKGLLSISRRMA